MNKIDVTPIIGDDLYLNGEHVATIRSSLHATKRQELVNMWLSYHYNDYVREQNIKNRAYADGYANGRISTSVSNVLDI